jgi:Flp pilus assembly pilin Flp
MMMLLRFFTEDDGADLIEYALLSATIGLCALAAWNLIPGKMLAAYVGWDTGVQNLSGCTPDPGGGGC